MSLSSLRFALAALVIATPVLLCAQAPQVSSGIYVLAEPTSSEPLSLDRGDAAGKLSVGEKLAARFDSAAITSESNDNSQLRLSVQCLITPGIEKKRMAIVLAGKAFYVTSITRVGDGSTSKVYFQADVAGPDIAQAIAEELSIKPQFRTHPGHLWVVSLRPDKDSYKVGDPISLNLTIKNVGQTPFAFTDGVLPPGWRNNQFEFAAFRHVGFETPLPDTGNATIQALPSTLVAPDDSHRPQRPRFVVLKPGDEFTKAVNLADWFKFDQPDSYRVSGMYRVQLQSLDNAHQTLWDDCAVGQCTFRIDQAAGK
jgi:hypothetical protein